MPPGPLTTDERASRRAARRRQVRRRRTVALTGFAAMVVLAEARVAVAVVDGLLTRTYFRNAADAVRRAGVASAHIHELGHRLATQASELERRGRPVDGVVSDLLG